MDVEVSQLVWRGTSKSHGFPFLFVRAYLLALLMRRRRSWEIDRADDYFRILFFGGRSPTLIPNGKGNDSKRQAVLPLPNPRYRSLAAETRLGERWQLVRNGNHHSNRKNERRGLFIPASAQSPGELTALY
jgi:hypothetical protein